MLDFEEIVSSSDDSQSMADETSKLPYFEVVTPLNICIRTTPSYWENIVTFKHPLMQGREEEVQKTLREPAEIRRSQNDPNVYLYYKSDPPYLTCVVAKHLNGEGFIITAYRTNRIKIGEIVWKI